MRSSASEPAIRSQPTERTFVTGDGDYLPSLISPQRRPREARRSELGSRKKQLDLEDIVHRFASEKRRRTDVRFMPLKRSQQRSSISRRPSTAGLRVVHDFEPYALKHTRLENRYSHLISATRMIKLEPPPAEVTSLEQWCWEAMAFRVIRSSFTFFRYARELRCLARWRAAARQRKLRKLKLRLAKKLFLSRESFAAPLIEIVGYAVDIGRLPLLDLTEESQPTSASVDCRDNDDQDGESWGDLPIEFSYLCPVGRVKRKARQALAAADLAKRERLLRASDMFCSGGWDNFEGVSIDPEKASKVKRLANCGVDDKEGPTILHTSTLSEFEASQEVHRKSAVNVITALINKVADVLQRARENIHTLVKRNDEACAERERARLESAAASGSVETRAVFRKDVPMTQAKEEEKRIRELCQREKDEKAEFGTFVKLADIIITEALASSAISAATSLLRRLDFARDTQQGVWEVTVSFVGFEDDDDESPPAWIARGLCEGGVPRLTEESSSVALADLADVDSRPLLATQWNSTSSKAALPSEERPRLLGSDILLFARDDNEWNEMSGGVSGGDVVLAANLLDIDETADLARRDATKASACREQGGTRFSPNCEEIQEATAHILHEVVLSLDNLPRLKNMWPFVDDISVSDAADEAESLARLTHQSDNFVREERIRAAETKMAECDEKLKVKEAKRRAKERLGVTSKSEVGTKASSIPCKVARDVTIDCAEMVKHDVLNVGIEENRDEEYDEADKDNSSISVARSSSRPSVYDSDDDTGECRPSQEIERENAQVEGNDDSVSSRNDQDDYESDPKREDAQDGTPVLVGTVERRKVPSDRSDIENRRQVTDDTRDCVYSLVTNDNQYCTTLRKISQEISASFERGAQYAAVLDTLRSLHDIDARTRQLGNTVATGGIIESDEQLCKMTDDATRDPRCWRSLAMRAARDVVLVTRDTARLKRWGQELNRSLPRGSCGAIECISRPLRQRLGLACSARRRAVRRDARRAARIHAKAARGAAVTARQLLEQYPDSFRAFTKHAATVASVRSFAWMVLDTLSVAAQKMTALLRHETLASEAFIITIALNPNGENAALSPDARHDHQRSECSPPLAGEKADTDDQVAASARRQSTSGARVSGAEKNRLTLDRAKEEANAMEIETVGHLSALRAEEARRGLVTATYLEWRDSQLPSMVRSFDVELTQCAKHAAWLVAELAEFAASSDEGFRMPSSVLADLEGRDYGQALSDLEDHHRQLVELRSLLEFVNDDGSCRSSTESHEPTGRLRRPSETTLTADLRASRVFFIRAHTLWETISKWTQKHNEWLSRPLASLDADELDEESRRYANESQALLKRLNRLPEDDTADYYSASLGDDDEEERTEPGSGVEARHGTAAETLVKETTSFRKLAPIAVNLRNPALKPRHWTKLGTCVMSDQTASLALEETVTTLADLVEFGIVQHADFVQRVSADSTAEAELEAAILSLESSWDAVSLPVFDVALAAHSPKDGKGSVVDDSVSDSLDFRSSIGTSVVGNDSKNADHDSFELGSLDDIIALINEQREFLRNAEVGDHGLALRTLILAWRARLDALHETLQTAEEVSTLIQSLESLLGDCRVRDQLSHARSRFADVSGKWKALLPYWYKDPRPMMLVTSPACTTTTSTTTSDAKDYNELPPGARSKTGVTDSEDAAKMPPAPCHDQLATWKNDIAVLEELKAEVNEHMAQKRESMPRFFFLSDRILLKTLSELQSYSMRRTVGPLDAVAKVLPLLFDAIFDVEPEIESDLMQGVEMINTKAQSIQRIAALVDAVGERFVLNAPVPLVGPPEGWLTHLEKEIAETLRTAFKSVYTQRALITSGDFEHPNPSAASCLAKEKTMNPIYGRPLIVPAELTIAMNGDEVDPQDAPIQTILLAERLIWTAEVSKVLNRLRVDSLNRLVEECAVVVQAHASELRHRRFSGVAHDGQAEPAVCAKKEALLVLAMYHRETTAAIAKEPCINGLDDWVWQSQLRFYDGGDAEAHRRYVPFHIPSGDDENNEESQKSTNRSRAEAVRVLNAKKGAKMTGGPRQTPEVGFIVRQAKAVLPVGAEYLGCAYRVVITPLASRCLLALTSAIDAMRGAAILGPRGSGRRDTVTTLASALQQRCITRCSADFGFDDSTAANSLCSIFAGIASTGAWFVLDVADRANDEKTSNLLQRLCALIDVLRDAMAAREPCITFPAGSTVPLKACAEYSDNVDRHSTLFCVSYSGMPLIAVTKTHQIETCGKSLQQVTCLRPDVVAITRLDLIARGFETETARRSSDALALIAKLAVEAGLGGGGDACVRSRWSARAALAVGVEAGAQLQALRNGKMGESAAASLINVKCQAGKYLEKCSSSSLASEDEAKRASPRDIARVCSYELHVMRQAIIAVMSNFVLEPVEHDMLLALIECALPLDQEAERFQFDASSAEQQRKKDEMARRILTRAFLTTCGGEPTERQLKVASTLEVALQSSFGVAIVGATGSGKTTTLRAVAAAKSQICDDVAVDVYFIVPRSLRSADVFGRPDDACGAGIVDRLLSRATRRSANHEKQREYWIILDGPSHEHIASEILVVHFDHVATVSSASSADIRLVLETDTLADVSPALVSRIGITLLPPFSAAVVQVVDGTLQPAAARMLSWFQCSQFEVKLIEGGFGDVVETLRGILEDPACPLDAAIRVARLVDYRRRRHHLSDATKLAVDTADLDKAAVSSPSFLVEKEEDARRLSAACGLLSSLFVGGEDVEPPDRVGTACALAWAIAWGVLGQAIDTVDGVHHWLEKRFVALVLGNERSVHDVARLASACAGHAPLEFFDDTAPPGGEDGVWGQPWASVVGMAASNDDSSLIYAPTPSDERALFALSLLAKRFSGIAPIGAVAVIEATERGCGVTTVAREFVAREARANRFFALQVAVGTTATAYDILNPLRRRLVYQSHSRKARGGAAKRFKDASQRVAKSSLARLAYAAPPDSNRRVLLVVDDVSAAAPEADGSLHELLRSFADHHDWFTLKDLQQKQVHEASGPVCVKPLGVVVLPVSSSNWPASCRARRLYAPVHVHPPSKAHLETVFNAILWPSGMQPPDAEKVVAATLDVILDAVPRVTPSHSQLWVASRVARALNSLCHNIRDTVPFGRLAIHELYRELHDFNVVTDNLQQLIFDRFDFEETILTDDEFVVEFVEQEKRLRYKQPPGSCVLTTDLSLPPKQQSTMLASTEAYVKSALLVLDAELSAARRPPSKLAVCARSTGHARHVARAARAMALCSPLVLVGPQGIGRRSCVQLAAFIVGIRHVFHAPPPLPPSRTATGQAVYAPASNTHTQTEYSQLDNGLCFERKRAAWTATAASDLMWLEVLRKAMFAALGSIGSKRKRQVDVQDEGAVIVITDSAWQHSAETARRLDDIKAVITIGYATRALRAEDVQNIVTNFGEDDKSSIRKKQTALKTREDQASVALEAFGRRVRRSLRVVLCATCIEAIAPTARTALESIGPAAVYDAFESWPTTAPFCAVAERFLGCEKQLSDLGEAESTANPPPFAWLVRLEDDARSGRSSDVLFSGLGLHRATNCLRMARDAIPFEPASELAKLCAETHAAATARFPEAASIYAFWSLLVAATQAAIWRCRMLTSAIQTISFAQRKVAEALRHTEGLESRLEEARTKANDAYQKCGHISQIANRAGNPVAAAIERREAAEKVAAETGEAAAKAQCAYREMLGEAAYVYEDALERLMTSLTDDACRKSVSGGAESIVHPVKLVLEGMSILLQDAKPSWECGAAIFSGNRDVTQFLRRWAHAAAHAAAGTTPSNDDEKYTVERAGAYLGSPKLLPRKVKKMRTLEGGDETHITASSIKTSPEKTRRSWKEAVTKAELATSDQCASSTLMKRAGSQGISVGYPTSLWVEAAIGLYRATSMQQAVTKWRLFVKAKETDDAAKDKLTLAKDAVMAARTVETAVKELSSMLKLHIGRADDEMNSIRAKQRVARERFAELEPTLQRWDARLATLTSDRARLPNVAVAAASTTAYAAAMPAATRAEFLSDVSGIVGEPVDERTSEPQTSSNYATYARLRARAPALCAPLSDDDACDLGGCGEGGLAYRTWEARGLFPGGVHCEAASAATAIATEPLRVPLLIDPYGDAAKWLEGAYDRRKWSSPGAASTLVCAYLDEAGDAFLAVPPKKRRQSDAQSVRGSFQTRVVAHPEISEKIVKLLQTSVAPVISAIHVALAVGAAVVLIELPDVFFESTETLRYFLEPLEPLLKARLDIENAVGNNPPITRVLTQYFGAAELGDRGSRSRIVFLCRVPGGMVRSALVGNGAASALALVDVEPKCSALRLVDCTLAALPANVAVYGGVAAASRALAERLLVAGIAAREHDDALLELAAALDPATMSKLPDGDTGETHTPALLSSVRLRFGLEKKASAAASQLYLAERALHKARSDLLPAATAATDIARAVDAVAAGAPDMDRVRRFAAIVQYGISEPRDAAQAAWLLERPRLDGSQLKAVMLKILTTSSLLMTPLSPFIATTFDTVEALEDATNGAFKDLLSAVGAARQAWCDAWSAAPHIWLFGQVNKAPLPQAVREHITGLDSVAKFLLLRTLRPDLTETAAMALASNVLGIAIESSYWPDEAGTWPPTVPVWRSQQRHADVQEIGTARHAADLIRRAFECTGDSSVLIVRHGETVAISDIVAAAAAPLRVREFTLGFASKCADDAVMVDIVRAAFNNNADASSRHWVFVKNAPAAWLIALMAILDIARFIDPKAMPTGTKILIGHDLTPGEKKIPRLLTQHSSVVTLERPKSIKQRLSAALADSGGVFGAQRYFERLLDQEQRHFYAQTLVRVALDARRDLLLPGPREWAHAAHADVAWAFWSDDAPCVSSALDATQALVRGARHALVPLSLTKQALPSAVETRPLVAMALKLSNVARSVAEGHSDWLLAPKAADLIGFKDYVKTLPDHEDHKILGVSAMALAHRPAFSKTSISSPFDQSASVADILQRATVRLQTATQARGLYAALWRSELERLVSRCHAVLGGERLSLDAKEWLTNNGPERQHQTLVQNWQGDHKLPQGGLYLNHLDRPGLFLLALRLESKRLRGHIYCSTQEPVAGHCTLKLCDLRLENATIKEDNILEANDERDACFVSQLWIWVENDDAFDSTGILHRERSSRRVNDEILHHYDCPLYRREPQSTGYSDQLLATFRFRSHRSPEFWALRVCALFLDG